ncbi:MAG: acetolactate synthase large subunit [Halobacteriovoraceae bacterium]|nr:acetolactate synthase large subunit [Halobacteriovoraceae bacterium]
MKASDLFVKCLENEGVEYIFGIPGEENLDILDSLRNSKIKLILTRHEQGAGFMAASYARLTGKVGVALATLGPGATNFMTCAPYALLGGMPVLFITGQKPIKKSKQGRFQIVDVVEMMNPVTKFAKQIVNGNNIPYLIRECFRVAKLEKPGSVHLELPEDIACEQIEGDPCEITAISGFEASQKAIDQAIKAIRAAKHPLLLVASGANRCGKVRQVIGEFIDKTKIFFCATQMGKGVIDERHPSYLGTAALSSHDYLHCAIDRSDLIVNIGHDVVEKPPFFMEKGGKTVIHISFFPANIDSIYFPQIEVVGDIWGSMARMTQAIKPSKNWDFSYFKKVKKEIDAHIEDRSDDTGFPLIPQRLVADVRSAISSDGIISLDNGMYKIWFARNYKAHQPNTLLLDNALATMGAGLPLAMGAKIVYPEKEVVAICGDGGFMMNSQELETAVRLKQNLVVIVLRDNAYGMIKWKQAGMDMPNFGLDFGNPDFVKYADSYGAIGHRINKSNQLSSLLKKCLAEKGVHLIEVPVDYSENEKVLLKELQSKTCLI